MSGMIAPPHQSFTASLTSVPRVCSFLDYAYQLEQGIFTSLGILTFEK
jgi:hypothetical protein